MATFFLQKIKYGKYIHVYKKKNPKPQGQSQLNLTQNIFCEGVSSIYIYRTILKNEI